MIDGFAVVRSGKGAWHFGTMTALSLPPLPSRSIAASWAQSESLTRSAGLGER